MKRTRRDLLRNASKLSAVTIGFGLAGGATAQTPPEWDPDTVYTSGDRVTYDGAIWEAQWWTQGDEPATGSGPWELVEDDGGGGGEYPEWDSEAVYTGGDRVVYDGYVWEAKWWTQGDEPGASEWGPWEQIEEHDPGPDAAFAVDPENPDPGETVTFDASDSEGEIESYEWDLGDRTEATGEVVEHAYDDAGEYDVELTVTDADGEADSASTTVAVGDEPPSASFTTDPAFPAPGDEIEFDASASEGEIESYEWDLGDGTETTGEVVTHAYDDAGEYEVELVVSDGVGRTDTETDEVTVSESGPEEARVVAYYRQWSQYGRNYRPEHIPYDKVTHVQYAFARPESDGSINLVGDAHGQEAFWDQGDDWRGIEGGTFAEHAAENPDTKFILSIGGWGDSKYFSDAALNEENRQRFAEDCVTWIERGNLDGIDIDWEYPGGGGCSPEDAELPGSVCPSDGNNVRPGDQERFTLLCETVREHLDEHAEEAGREEPYELTAAVSANPDVIEGVEDGNDGLEHEQLSEHLDFLNVMTFDYRGIWTETTGHHAPLKENPDDPFEESDVWNAEYGLQYWADQGWDPAQLNMAVPFYGRSWSDVQTDDDGLFEEYEGDGPNASAEGSFPSDPGSNLGGVWDWFDLGGNGRGNSNTLDLDADHWETYFDEESLMSWSYSEQGSPRHERVMISHETLESMEAKMNWLRDSPYGGTMLWAIGGDNQNHDLIDTLWSTLRG